MLGSQLSALTRGYGLFCSGALPFFATRFPRSLFPPRDEPCKVSHLAPQLQGQLGGEETGQPAALQERWGQLGLLAPSSPHPWPCGRLAQTPLRSQHWALWDRCCGDPRMHLGSQRCKARFWGAINERPGGWLGCSGLGVVGMSPGGSPILTAPLAFSPSRNGSWRIWNR